MKEYRTARPAGREAVMEAVVEAAIELFSTRAYRDVTVVEIGRSAAVNPGLIHLYFGSKEEVLHEAAAVCMDRLQRGYSLSRKGREGTEALIRAFSENRHYFHLLLTAATSRLERPLALRLGDLPEKLAESLGWGEEGPLTGLSGKETALGLLVMGIGSLVLERIRDAGTLLDGRGRDFREENPLEFQYPRWLKAVAGGYPPPSSVRPRNRSPAPEEIG